MLYLKPGKIIVAVDQFTLSQVLQTVIFWMFLNLTGKVVVLLLYLKTRFIAISCQVVTGNCKSGWDSQVQSSAGSDVSEAVSTSTVDH